jgi:hypothetical protein
MTELTKRYQSTTYSVDLNGVFSNVVAWLFIYVMIRKVATTARMLSLMLKGGCGYLPSDIKKPMTKRSSAYVSYGES